MADVRPADENDLERVAVLFDAYRQFYGQAPDLALAREFLAARMRQAESIVLLAERGDAILGFTQLYPTFCSVSAGRTLVVYDLFVAPSVRRQGVGRALLRAARAAGREAQCVRLELATAVSNRPAQQLYESEGWARDDMFHRYLLVLDPRDVSGTERAGHG